MDTENNTTPSKARSRLKPNREESTSGEFRSHRTKKDSSTEAGLLHKYLQFSPLLIIALIHVGLLTQVIQTVSPDSWQHFLLPNSYLPMLFLLMATAFWSTSYLFLNTARGIRISLFVGIYFFLQFQQVILTSPLLFVLLGSFFGIELLCSVFAKIGHSKKQ